MNTPCITIIIPTLNEEYFIKRLIPHIVKCDEGNYILELLVADGGSTDRTCYYAKKLGANVIHCPATGRAKQMNYAAWHSKGEILHFIHADAFPPKGFSSAVVHAFSTCRSGCFRSRFDSQSRFLRLNSYFTRFRPLFFRGGGQTLFVDFQLFVRLSGYDESLEIMEEYDLISRLKKVTSFEVIQRDVIVSARDYDIQGSVLLQVKYLLLMLLFFVGVPNRYINQTRKRICGGKVPLSKENGPYKNEETFHSKII